MNLQIQYRVPQFPLLWEPSDPVALIHIVTITYVDNLSRMVLDSLSTESGAQSTTYERMPSSMLAGRSMCWKGFFRHAYDVQTFALLATEWFNTHNITREE